MTGLGPDMSALNLLSQANLNFVLNKVITYISPLLPFGLTNPTYILQIQGKKQLILESGLMKPLDRVANMSVLTKAGVDKVFKFGKHCH